MTDRPKSPLAGVAPARMNEVSWVEPYPDLRLDEVIDTAPPPEARYEANESISLAFVTALQLLSPQQRAVLVLRDVLGFRARDAAEMLDITLGAANSALKRARKGAAERSTAAEFLRPPDGTERDLIERLTSAYTAGDVEAILGLLSEDVWLSMPPLPFEYQGLEAASEGLALMFGDGRRFRLVETRANRQPAFGLYVRDPRARLFHATGLLVVTLRADAIAAMTWFDKSVLARFGLPRTLPV